MNGELKMGKSLRIIQKYMEFYVKPFLAHTKTICHFCFYFLKCNGKFCRKYTLKRERERVFRGRGGFEKKSKTLSHVSWLFYPIVFHLYIYGISTMLWLISVFGWKCELNLLSSMRTVWLTHTLTPYRTSCPARVNGRVYGKNARDLYNLYSVDARISDSHPESDSLVCVCVFFSSAELNCCCCRFFLWLFLFKFVRVVST